MKVLCLLALLTAADGNSDISEIINEIFGTLHSTTVVTSDNDNRNSTTITTRKTEHNFTDFANTLRKIIEQKSKPKSKSRLRISVSNSTANLCNYGKNYLQTLLGDWILTKFYTRNFTNIEDLGLFSNCIKIRLAPSKGICKCHDKHLPVFNAAVTCENPKMKYIKDVAVAFVSHFKDAIKFGNKLCQCKRIIVTARVLSNNYILLYDNLTNTTDVNYFVVLARNLSALWELDNLEETTPELMHRKGEVLCEGVVFYTTLKTVGKKSDSRKRKALKVGFALSSLSFFDYLNTIPRDEVIDIAFSSGVAI